MKKLLKNIFAPFCVSDGTDNHGKQVNKSDYVVMLHGIVRTSKSMNQFARYFENRGYHVVNINYPSTKHTVEELAEQVFQEITEKCVDKNKKINFVAYSMGSLITRYILANKKLENLGRVVFVAPPSSGSELADFLKDNFLYKKIYGISGQQLGTDENSVARKLPPVNDYEVGVIAGDLPANPLFWKILPGANDGTVAVERTKIEGMKDHITVKASHTFIINSGNTMEQAVFFLENGRFSKEIKVQ